MSPIQQVTAYRHADPCDCGDPQHCGAFGCPCMTVAPDPESPCGYEGCDPGEWVDDPHECWCGFDQPGDQYTGHHPHVPTLCRCRHRIEVAP